MLLEVNGLAAAYGRVPALHRVDFAVNRREVVGILGHNGMGKTTLMRALMGFVKVTAGSVTFDGRPLDGWTASARARAGLGLVPQGRQIFANLTVDENLRSGISGRRAEVEAKLEEMLGLFPRLSRLLDRKGGALSGGEQQLLALARCLARDPKLMLLDEPTEGIQPSINEEIAETLNELVRTRDITIVLVEQNLEFIRSLSHRVYAISNGVLDRQIPVSQLDDPSAVNAFMGFSA